MYKKYIFIDESGNPGINKNSPEPFVISAVAINGESDKYKLNDIIVNFKNKIYRKADTELKFRKTNTRLVQELLKSCNPINYSVHAIILEKEGKSEKLDIKTTNYLYILKKLLTKMDLNNANVYIDGSYGSNFTRKAKPYLRKGSTSVNCNIRFCDSKKYPLIQFADITAGTIARHLSNNKNDVDCFNTIRNKIATIIKV